MNRKTVYNILTYAQLVRYSLCMFGFMQCGMRGQWGAAYLLLGLGLVFAIYFSVAVLTKN